MSDNTAESGSDSMAAGNPANQSAGEEIALKGPSSSKPVLPLLVVLEGSNDIEFLRRISAKLNATDATMPNLFVLERGGEIVFVPFGGGEIQSWAYRFAPLGKPEFQLYDREVSPLSELRYTTARIVNLRSGCRAFVTIKRSLENYLHPQAIFEVSGIQIEFGDNDDVAELVAQKRFLTREPNRDWLAITSRCRRRLRNQAKPWLNRAAVDRMTAERMAERDPDGEVRNCLTTIAEMVGDLD